MSDGDEIEFHVHQPDGSQPRVWVSRKALNEACTRAEPSAGGEFRVAARTACKESEVAFVFDDSDEVEVQAGWWIWVGKRDLSAALAELGVRAPALTPKG